jgi:hypothetical protein
MMTFKIGPIIENLLLKGAGWCSHKKYHYFNQRAIRLPPPFKVGIKRRLVFELSMGEKAKALPCGSSVLLAALESGSRRLRTGRTSTNY